MAQIEILFSGIFVNKIMEDNLNNLKHFVGMNWLFILLVSAFGPYLFISIGIRLDHIIIYSLLTFLLVTNLVAIKIHPLYIFTILVLLIVCLVPFVALFLNDSQISNSLILSQIENYTQPLAITIICFSIFNNCNVEQIESGFIFFLKLFVILMAIHTLLSVAMNFFPELLFWRRFTGAGLIALTDDAARTGLTAAELARLGGRISGIFTQVFEAGFAYSIAIISWSFLYTRFKKFLIFQNAILLLILLGGILVNSKIFIVFGLPLAIYLFNQKKKLFLYSSIFTVISLYALKLVSIDFSFFAKTLKYVRRLSNVNLDNFLQVFTGGRFEPDSSIITGMIDIYYTSPLIGMGYGSIETSDFSLYEVLSLGGLLSIFFYLLLFAIFIGMIYAIKNTLFRKYYISLIILTVFSSLAAPTITANRISLIFWLLWCFFAAMIVNKSRSNLAEE